MFLLVSGNYYLGTKAFSGQVYNHCMLINGTEMRITKAITAKYPGTVASGHYLPVSCAVVCICTSPCVIPL